MLLQEHFVAISSYLRLVILNVLLELNSILWFSWLFTAHAQLRTRKWLVNLKINA